VASFTPDVPGRGAWTLTGGLLRLRPGHANSTGYYRLNADGEQPVGKAGQNPTARTHSQRVVHAAVKDIQRLIGAWPDGVFGPKTSAAVVTSQRLLGLADDGIVGPATMRALLGPLVLSTAMGRDVPSVAVGGIAAHESRLDPAAVGVVNGLDTGVCQINLGAVAARDISVEAAISPWFALAWTARELAAARDRYEGRTHGAPLLSVMIANHNSPASAQKWADTGVPPFSQRRADQGFPQIDEYVASVLAAWEGTA
jgi:hypothetical protein